MSPTGDVFYTIETLYGHGAPDSDFTRVYAHLERAGRSDRELVLSGEYVELSAITWTGPSDVTLCLRSGFTDSFRNEVTLGSGRTAQTLRNHLDENCEAGATNFRR